MDKKKYPRMGILSARVKEDTKTIEMRGWCILKYIGSKEKLDTDFLSIDVPVQKDAGTISFGSRYGVPVGKRFRLNHFVLTFDIDEALKYDIQNKVELVYKDQYKGRILYRPTDLKKERTEGVKYLYEKTA